MTIILDRVEDVDLVWPALEPWFDAVPRRMGTDLTAAEIRRAALAGRLTVWTTYDREQPVPVLGVAAIGVVDCDGEDVAEIFSLGGRNIRDWLPDAFAQFEALARANGVGRIRIDGRTGWARIMRPLGFSVTSRFISRPNRLRMEKVLWATATKPKPRPLPRPHGTRHSPISPTT